MSLKFWTWGREYKVCPSCGMNTYYTKNVCGNTLLAGTRSRCESCDLDEWTNDIVEMTNIFLKHSWADDKTSQSN